MMMTEEKWQTEWILHLYLSVHLELTLTVLIQWHSFVVGFDGKGKQEVFNWLRDVCFWRRVISYKYIPIEFTSRCLHENVFNRKSCLWNEMNSHQTETEIIHFDINYRDGHNKVFKPFRSVKSSHPLHNNEHETKQHLNWKATSVCVWRANLWIETRHPFMVNLQGETMKEHWENIGRNVIQNEKEGNSSPGKITGRMKRR